MDLEADVKQLAPGSRVSADAIFLVLHSMPRQVKESTALLCGKRIPTEEFHAGLVNLKGKALTVGIHVAH
jgi:hypothetical protein